LSFQQKLNLESPLLSRNLMLTLLIAAALRLTFLFVVFVHTGTAEMTRGDTSSYLEPGRNLVLHGSYATAGRPELDRTPGYPVFAMLTGMLWGNAVATALIQVVLSLASIVLVKKIASQIFSDSRVPATAAWLFALEPISTLYVVRIMPETLFTLLLLVVIDRMVCYQDSAKLLNISQCGLVLSVATYVRPVSYYLVLPFACALMFTSRNRPGHWWKAPVILLLSTVPFLAAWQIRNRIETGFIGYSSIVEKNLFFYQSAEVTARLNNIPLQEQQRRLGYFSGNGVYGLPVEIGGDNLVEQLKFMRERSKQIIEQHRALYLRLHFEGVLRVALKPCADEFLALIGAYPEQAIASNSVWQGSLVQAVKTTFLLHAIAIALVLVAEVYLVLLYLMAAASFLKIQGKCLGIMTLSGVCLYFLVISGGAQASGRYRLPIMPELCILSAGGLGLLSQRKSGIRRSHSN
jgi:hypothetical protein